MEVRRFCLLVVGVFLLSACKHDKFTIEGKVENADDQVVYLDKIDFTETVCIDSAKVKSDGTFSFSDSNAEHNPLFFKVTCGEKSCVVPIDSTETVTLNIAERISFINSPSAETLSNLPREDKNNVKRVIFKNPSSAVAVYALLLQDGNKPMFDLSNNHDAQFYSMVATAYDKNHPTSEYTPWLKNMVLNKKAEQQSQQNLIRSLMQSTEKGAFDISLPDINGEIRSLSELKGKQVLLVFSYFDSNFYSEEEYALRDIYNTGKFEIFSVSFDQNYASWHSKASLLPWIAVHDKSALQSVLISTYNISTLPSFFLVDEQGDVVARYSTIAEVYTLTK